MNKLSRCIIELQFEELSDIISGLRKHAKDMHNSWKNGNPNNVIGQGEQRYINLANKLDSFIN